MLRFMLPQPRLRQTLSLLESRALGNRKPPQPGQVAAACAGLAKFISESLTFQTA
jgi:hypothetical protein